MRHIIGVLLALALSGCFGPSDEQLQKAQNQCEEFVLKQLGSRGIQLMGMEPNYLDETHVFDTYTKKDKIVVEVGYRNKNSWGRDDHPYSVRICIYDEKAGTISLPSIFNMNDWRK